MAIDYTTKYKNRTSWRRIHFESMKSKIKIMKAELDWTFLTNCQTLNFYQNFLTFSLPNVTWHNARFIRKRLLRSAITETNKQTNKKELQSLRKDSAVYEKEIAKSLSSIDKYILQNTIPKNVFKCSVKTIKTYHKKLKNLTKMSHYRLQILKLPIICPMLR